MMGPPLTDAQVERYSRQIILPEIGGSGQRRLLGAAVGLIGTGALASVAARYLAGAGVGRLWIDPAGGAATALRDELQRLNVDCVVTLGRAPAADGLVAVDLPPAPLDAVARECRAVGRTLVAAGRGDGGGWLYVAAGGRGCACCVARAAGGDADGARRDALAPVAAGVLGSLVALAALRAVLGLGAERAPDVWWHFDAARTHCEARPAAASVGCTACAAPM